MAIVMLVLMELLTITVQHIFTMILVFNFTAYPGTHVQKQSGHPSQPQHTIQVGITSQRIFIVQTFRESPVGTTCLHCRSDILTSTHHDIETIT